MHTKRHGFPRGSGLADPKTCPAPKPPHFSLVYGPFQAPLLKTDLRVQRGLVSRTRVVRGSTVTDHTAPVHLPKTRAPDRKLPPNHPATDRQHPVRRFTAQPAPEPRFSPQRRRFRSRRRDGTGVRIKIFFFPELMFTEQSIHLAAKPDFIQCLPIDRSREGKDAGVAVREAEALDGSCGPRLCLVP
ncbi:hypothetical protein CB1_000832017 [Camelus ferus]|nr:hypothetical protein CB1_000832017 [Camelus ferus]